MNNETAPARGTGRQESQQAYNRANYGEIIRAARTARGLQQQELSLLLNMSKNTVSNWEAGRTRPDINLIPRLCTLLGLTIPQFFGEEEPADDEDAELLARLRKLSPANRSAVEAAVSAFLEAQKKQEETVQFIDLRRVYVSPDAVSAGTGEFLAGQGAAQEAYLRVTPLTRRADEIITVNGDSMEPTFRSGDRVLVQHAPYVLPGEIGVFIDGTEGLIKEYRRDGLHSHNPKYKTRKFSEFSDVRCIGRVLGAVRPNMYASAEEIEAWKNGQH